MNKPQDNPIKNIIITGATSGLGWAMAIQYAEAGIHLFLTGRNQEKLQQISEICRQKQANVSSKIIDIKDGQAVKNWVREIGQNFNLDLVIANAGISAGTALGNESVAQIEEIFQTNIDGVLNTINPAIEVMKNQIGKNYQNNSNYNSGFANLNFKGQIVIISSLAGFRGLPSSPSYSASKACVRVYGEALRGSLAPMGIWVNVVCPGYIKTPMTAVNNFFMPFLMEAPKAAEIIQTSLKKNKSRIAFPFVLYFVVWLASLISTTITDPIFAKLPKKTALNKAL